MSFVVMGMEAPENCLKCPMNCRTPDGKILCRRDFQERNPKIRDRCSILPLPETHGNLIDETPPMKYFLANKYEKFVGGYVAMMLMATPTIVKAEGE